MARHQYTNSPPPLGVDQSRLSQVYSNAPGSSAEETIDRLALQILQQGTSDRWTGQGGGDRYTNARWMASELYNKGGITRLEDFGRGYVDVPTEVEVVERYDPETGGNSYYKLELDPITRSSFNFVKVNPTSLVTRQNYTEYGEGGGYYDALYMPDTYKKPAYYNKATGQFISDDYGDSDIWGRTYSGDGMTQYGVQFNELGMPIFYTQYQDNSDWNLISTLVTVGTMIPGVAPFAQALNAAMQAYSGNTTGAILSALGSAYSFGQQYSNLGSDAIEYVKKAAEAGETSSSLSKVADFFYENAGKIKTAQQAGQLFSALNNQDLAGIIGGLQGLAPQIGVTVPESAVKAIQVAAVSQAVSRGDVTGALLAAGTLTKNSDLTLAGKGAAIIKAAETGNPIAMLSAAIDFGKTTKTMAPKDVQSALKKAGLPVSETVAADLMSKDPESVAGILDAQFKAAKDAREIYKQESGSELPDSFFESRYELTPSQLKDAADKLYTTQEEAQKLWADNLGDVKSTDFDIMQIQGLSEADANRVIGQEKLRVGQALDGSKYDSFTDAIQAATAQGKDSVLIDNTLYNVDGVNQVARLYRENFGREPDAGGLKYWSEQFGASVDPKEAERFLSGPDAQKEIEAFAGDKANIQSFRNQLGYEPTAKDLESIRGKPQDQVDAYINNLANVDEGEARQFFKDVYGKNYEPTKEEILSVMGVSDAASKNLVEQGYNQKLDQRKADAFDGSGYESLDDAMKAAAKAGKTDVTFDGSLYNIKYQEERLGAMTDAVERYAKSIGKKTIGDLNDQELETILDKVAAIKDPALLRQSSIQDIMSGNVSTQATQFNAPISLRDGVADLGSIEIGRTYNSETRPEKFDLPYGARYATPQEIESGAATFQNLGDDYSYTKDGKNVYVGAPQVALVYTDEDLPDNPVNRPDESSPMGAVNAANFVKDNLSEYVADPYARQAIIDVLATGTYGLAEITKTFSDAVWSTGLVDRNNVTARVADALKKWGEGAQSGWTKKQEDAILSEVDKAEGMGGKFAALMKGVANNPGGAVTLLFKEGIQEIPNMLGGKAAFGLAKKLFGTAAATSVALGVDSAIDSLESYGAAYGETYDNIIKKGGNAANANDAALKAAFISAGVTFASEFVGDAAIVKSYLGELKDLTAGSIAKESAKQYFLGGAEEYAQNVTTQYYSYGKVDQNQAKNSFIIGGFLEAGVGGGFLSIQAINDKIAIGKDKDGNDVTVGEYVSGQKQIEPGTLNKSVNLMGDGRTLSLGDVLNYNVVESKDPNITVADYYNAASAMHSLGFDNLSAEDITNAIGGAYGLSSQEMLERVDAETFDPSEASEMFGSMGVLNPTDEQIERFAGIGNVSTRQEDLRSYADPLGTDEDEVRQIFQDVGITSPTPEQISKFVGSAPEADVSRQIKDAYPGISPAPEGGPGSLPVESVGAGTGGGYGPGISDVVTPDTGGTTGGTTGGEQTQPQGVTAEQVNQLINQAIANNPGITQAQVQQIVNDAISTLPQGASLEAVQGIVNAAIAGIPAGITTDDVKSIVDEAIANNPGLSQEDVSNIVNDAIASNPGITVDDVKTVVNDAISGITPGVTTDQVQQIVNDAIASNPSLTAGQVQQIVNDAISANPSITLDQVQSVVADAISGIQPGVTQDQVQQIVNDAIASNPGVTEDQVRQIVNDAVAGVPAGTTTEQIQQIVNDAISGIPSGVTQDDVQSIINDALAKNPGVTEEQVRQIVGDAVSSLPAGTSLGQIQQIVDNAVAGIQPGTTEEQVREIVGEATGNVSTELKAKYDALSAEQKALADALVQQGSDLGTAIDDAVSSIKSDVQSKYDALSAEQKALADALVNQGADLNTAIETVASNLQSQMQEQYNSLSESQKALADALIQQGVDTSTAIQQAVTQLQTEAQTRYDALTEQQQAMADALVQQGVDLNTAINTVASQIQTQIQEQYNALTEQQKALADAMTQQGVDLQTAIDVASTQTQQQITQLGTSLDTRINELVQQGQTYQQATTNAINELTTQNQNLQGLIGTQGRDVTQGDIDLLTGMVAGTTPIDLSYDVNGDKQITQADIDWLAGVTSGTNVDWQPPQGSAWAPTGLYGQIFDIERQRREDADAARRAADQAAADAAARDAANRAEAQRQATISRVGAANLAANQQAQQLAQQVQQYQKASQETTTPIYAGEIQDFDLGAPLDFGFLKPSKEKQAGQSGGQTTKIASGGYLDDLLDLLK